ncbi:MAG: fluoride efflux transporter CrcB [Polyangia bacterium]|jgi:CrcB protein
MKLGALLLVGAGGFLGAITRYVVGTGVSHRWGASWPYGTFLINITGCFAIAFFLTLVSERITVSPNWRYFFPTGFVGAYTTFSTFEYETLRLVEDGAWVRALSYVVSSVIVGFVAVLLAAWLARRL